MSNVGLGLGDMRGDRSTTNQEAYRYVIDMIDLENSPSLLAKFKVIAQDADGHAAWQVLMRTCRLSLR